MAISCNMHKWMRTKVLIWYRFKLTIYYNRHRKKCSSITCEGNYTSSSITCYCKNVRTTFNCKPFLHLNLWGKLCGIHYYIHDSAKLIYYLLHKYLDIYTRCTGPLLQYFLCFFWGLAPYDGSCYTSWFYVCFFLFSLTIWDLSMKCKMII